MNYSLLEKYKRYILKTIFTLVFFELFIGGTGRLFEITSFLTLRMCLFLIYLPLVLLHFVIKGKIDKYIIIIIGYFLFSILFASFIGIANDSASSAIFEDIKPLLNIFLIPYLYYSIKSKEDINYILKLIKISSILLTIMHFVIYTFFLINPDIGKLTAVLTIGEGTQFFFKGDSGFLNYTGDLYLCIAFIVWDQYHKKTKLKYFVLILIFIAIVLTGTRGLLFALAAVYFIKWCFLKFNYVSLFYIIVSLSVFFAVYINIKDSIGDKEDSDRVRYVTINQVIDRVNPLSFVIGHGFGNGVPERPDHMEISYLEVFHKQGILGLAYYFIIFILCYTLYKGAAYKYNIGFYMFVLFVYLLTLTNPYINHPLGLTIISIAFVCMLKLNQYQKETAVNL